MNIKFFEEKLREKILDRSVQRIYIDLLYYIHLLLNPINEEWKYW